MTEAQREYIPKLGFKNSRPWKSYRIDEIFDFKKNAINSRADLEESGNINYIHYGDIHTKYNGLIDFRNNTIPFLKDDLPIKADFIQNGDIIIADASEDEEGIGKAVEVCNLLNEKKAISGLHTIVLRPHKNIFSSFFASYLFSSDAIKKQFLKIATGIKVYSLAKSALKSVELMLPTIDEQQKIADCLSSLDELIEAHEQNRTALVEHKKGLMQRLFPVEGETTPRWRFPEFQKAKMWETCPLGPLTTKIGSGVTPRGGEQNYLPVGIPFVRSQNVGWGKLLLNDIVFIPYEIHETLLSTELQLEDVLLNITGASIGRCARVNQNIEGGNVNQHVCIIRAKKEKLNSNFLMQYIISSCGQKQIDSYQAGGNRQGLNFAQVAEFTIPLPSLPEQQKIADCLSSLDSRIEAEATKIASLREHKQGLMQRLFPQSL